MTLPLPFATPAWQLESCALGQEGCNATVVLDTKISAPPNLVLRGWRGQADSPEEMEDLEGCLCLLACVQGQFVPVRPRLVSQDERGQRAVQVTFSVCARSHLMMIMSMIVSITVLIMS